MHILVIPSWYSTPENPVAGCFFKEQALALARAGHKVGMLVAPRLKPVYQVWKARHFADFRTKRSYRQEDGLWTFRTSQWSWFPGPISPSLKSRWTLFLAREAIESYLRQEGRPDIVHAHGALSAGLLGARMKESPGTPTVLTEHSSAYLADLIRRRELPLIKTVLRSMDRVLAVGPALASALQRILPGLKVEVVGNIVDTDFFRPSGVSKASDHFLLVAQAVLTRRKRLDRLLEAFSKAFSGRQKVRLIIGGDGPERRRLQELTAELGLSKQVSFPGLISREKVRELFQRAHVVVSSSDTETFGVTLIEAMACGTPVVATRSGGPESFVNARNGVIVEKGVRELAEALIRVRSGYASYDPSRIRGECKDRFSEPAICGQLATIYREVIKEGGSPTAGRSDRMDRQSAPL